MPSLGYGHFFWNWPVLASGYGCSGENRVIAVASPLKARTICTMRHAKIVVIIVWCLSFLLAVPTAFVMNHKRVGLNVTAYWCMKELPEPDHSKAYELYMLILLFIIPVVVMVTTYVIICLKVWEFTDMRTDMRHGRVIAPVTKERVRSSIGGADSSLLGTAYNGGARPSARTERKKDAGEDNKTTKQLVIMLVTVVVLFAICWGPILISNVLTAFGHLQQLNYHYLKPMRMTFNLLSYFNSCINPIVYAFMSKNFRQSFKFAICACLKGKAFVRAYRFSMSIGSTRTSAVSNGVLRPGSVVNRDKSSSSNENTQTHVTTDEDIVELRALSHISQPAV
ncbi:hypothetical protein Btru_057032 [Bulinus truncatus]|nr:hypothetical protein Btru_057032 [Bulinus truncatus]